MPERGGPVLLEEEVADPGEGIAAHERREQPPRIAGGDARSRARQCAAAADEVQAPRGAIAVFAEVERIELAEACEAGHGRVLVRPESGIMPQPPAPRSPSAAARRSASFARVQ